MPFVRIIFFISVITSGLFATISVQGCHHNRNVTKLVPVTRTRLQTTKGNESSFRKWLGLKKPRIEEYTDFETKMELISECCVGYEMTRENRCIPICPLGCQKFATCISPSECQCNDGYLEKKSTEHSVCIPDCSSAPCPENSECIAPNQCACVEGYKRQGFNCEQKCSINCIHGECDEDGNKCNCYPGYVINEDGFCIDEEDEEMETEHFPMFSSQQQQQQQQETATKEKDFNDGSEENENDFNSTSTATFNTDYTTEILVYSYCPEGFIQHKDDCRPVIDDAESAMECKEKCQLNSFCSSNGQCICKSGFELWTSGECINPNEFTEAKSSDYPYWINIFLIIIVCFFILGVIIKASRRFLVQSGDFDVKDKHYEYDVEYKKGNKEQCSV